MDPQWLLWPTLLTWIFLLGLPQKSAAIDAQDVADKTREDLRKAGTALEKVVKSVDMDTLRTALDVFASAAEPFEVFGAASGAISRGLSAFLPNSEHQQIMDRFDQLNANLTAVRNDINQLEQEIKWQSTQLQYVDVVRNLREMTRLTNEIGNLTAYDETEAAERNKGYLKDMCNDHNCWMDLKTLLEGVGGQGDFSNNILDAYYDHSKANGTGITLLSTRMMQLISAGETSFYTYIAAEHGQNATRDFQKEIRRLHTAASEKIEAVVQRCKNEYEDNISDDLETIMANGGSTSSLAKQLFDGMKLKYNFLDITAAVYLSTSDTKVSYIAGKAGTSSSLNDMAGNSAVVFYRNNTKAKYYPHSLPKAKEIANKYKEYWPREYASNMVNKVKNELDSNKVKWYGIIFNRVDKPCGVTPYCRYSGHLEVATDWPNAVHIKGTAWNILILVGEY